MRMYSEEQIQDILDNYLINHPDGVFYREKMLNYSSQSVDYSDIIAEWILKKQMSDKSFIDNLLLNGSNMRTENPFKKEPVHKVSDVRFSQYSAGTTNKRNEENIAKRLFQLGAFVTQNGTGNITSILDYQVPVNRTAGSREGKVDLILKDGQVCLLGELKDDKSKETMLRAIVEAETYSRKIKSFADAAKRFKGCYDTNLFLPAVLFFRDTRPYYDFKEMQSGRHKNLYKLCKSWDVMFFEVESDLNNVPFDYDNNTYLLKQLYL